MSSKPYPRLHEEPPPPDDDGSALPDAESLADERYYGARQRLRASTAGYPEFPFPSLAKAAAPMKPGDLVMVMARTDVGKTTFNLTLFDALIESGKFGLYCGMEQDDEDLTNKWAAMRAGVSYRLVAAPKKHEYGTPEWDEAVAKVEAQIEELQGHDRYRLAAHFARERRIDRAKLVQWTKWAKDNGCAFVIVDHIDRMDHGDGRNSFHELSETVRLAKELAVTYRLVMIVASQVGRPKDWMEWFMPPSLHEMRGAGTKEEESDTVLSLARVLKPHVTMDMLKQFRRKLIHKDQVVEPNLTSASLLKHRIDGSAVGHVTSLAFDHGRYIDTRYGERCALCGVSLARIDTHRDLCIACAKGVP